MDVLTELSLEAFKGDNDSFLTRRETHPVALTLALTLWD